MLKPSSIFGRLGNSLFQYAYIFAQMRKGEIPDIYLQDPKYFDDFSGDFKKLMGVTVGYVPKVAIHVRRGDYVNNPFYVDLTKTDYYPRAMEMFKGSQFIVFSDNITWCEEQEMFKGCEFFHGTEMEDLNKMSECVGHIIANSSFSWWGAYLAPHTQKVIYPKNWYTDGISRTICPQHWICI